MSILESGELLLKNSSFVQSNGVGLFIMNDVPQPVRLSSPEAQLP
jgi:hypothetical protein